MTTQDIIIDILKQQGNAIARKVLIDEIREVHAVSKTTVYQALAKLVKAKVIQEDNGFVRMNSVVDVTFERSIVDRMHSSTKFYEESTERDMIGILLVADGSKDKLFAELKPDYFYNPMNYDIYNRLSQQWEVTGKLEISSLGLREETYEYVCNIMTESGSGYQLLNKSAYIRRLKEAYHRRSIVESSKNMLGSFLDDPDDEGVLDGVLQITNSVRDIGEINSIRKCDTIINSVVSEIENTQAGASRKKFLKTGYPAVDLKMFPLLAGQVLTIAARPGLGKTSFAMNLALNMSALGQNVLFMSLEMDEEELMTRMLSMRTTIDSRAIMMGHLSIDEWKRIHRAAEKIHELPMYMDCDPYLSPTILRAKLSKIKNLSGLEIVVVDYLQLMQSDNSRDEGNLNLKVTNISRKMKLIAKEFGVLIIQLSQLNRDIEREKREPQLTDLRESGSIEQDSDKVAFLYSKKQAESTEDNLLDLDDYDVLVKKNRLGETGRVRMLFKKAYGLISEPLRERVAVTADDI